MPTTNRKSANRSVRRNARVLKKLTPAEFEHLIYDLVTQRGAQNVAWRTPGADGGRDIEALIGEPDFSGYLVSKKWYVECKRYASSVDWPTIYSKIAYADSQGASVLLMCTTATFSPNAISEVDLWNSSSRNLQVRLWPAHELELQLARHPDLLLKYGLSPDRSKPGQSFLALSMALSKAVSSHFSREVFAGHAVDRMLDCAQSFASLLQHRMEDLERFSQIQPTYFSRVSEAVGSEVTNDGYVEIDGFALKALISYLSALLASTVRIKRQDDYRIGAAPFPWTG